MSDYSRDSIFPVLPVNFAVSHCDDSNPVASDLADHDNGIAKVIVDPKSDRVLGVGLAGPGAGELIAEAVVVIEMGGTAKDLAMCIHPHPTLNETIWEASESLHGLATHLYVAKKKVL